MYFKLAAGKVGVSRTTAANLLASHSLDIANQARIGGQYALAIEWLREAIRLAKTDGTADIPTLRVELLSTIRDVSKYKSYSSRPINVDLALCLFAA